MNVQIRPAFWLSKDGFHNNHVLIRLLNSSTAGPASPPRWASPRMHAGGAPLASPSPFRLWGGGIHYGGGSKGRAGSRLSLKEASKVRRCPGRVGVSAPAKEALRSPQGGGVRENRAPPPLIATGSAVAIKANCRKESEGPPVFPGPAGPLAGGGGKEGGRDREAARGFRASWGSPPASLVDPPRTSAWKNLTTRTSPRSQTIAASA